MPFSLPIALMAIILSPEAVTKLVVMQLAIEVV
jgi:hypothetical protein